VGSHLKRKQKKKRITVAVVVMVTDFHAKCEKCETINTITLVMGELKKQV
jgi:hypothetical protein